MDIKEKMTAFNKKRRELCDVLWVKAEHSAPPGFDLARARIRYILAVGLSGFAMLVEFVARWDKAYDKLFEWRAEGRSLRVGAVLPGFLTLLQGTGKYFLFLALVIVLMVIGNYSCYYQGSKSIYVMKRLPSRLEIHRRAWTLPLLSVLGILAALVLTALLCLLFYRLCSPAECMPERWFA